MLATIDLGGIAEAMVTGFGIVGAGWAVARWANRPRFICGIPPSVAERQAKGIEGSRLGRPSVSHGYRHRPRCFAHRLWRRHKRQLTRRDMKKASHPYRCRVLDVDRDGAVTFPVVVANRGHRIATDYTVSIIFIAPGAERGVQLVDVLTESLEFNLYVSDPDSLVRSELRTRVSAEAIRRDYDSYMADAHAVDGIYLSGSIVESGSYEIVHVEARAEDSLSGFFVLYTISCTDSWMRDATYVQRCELSRAGDLAPGNPPPDSRRTSP